MKFAVFYFSGTGNTKWIVSSLNKQLETIKAECALYAVESLKEDRNKVIMAALQNSDVIGFATPIYGADFPLIMRNFIVDFVRIAKGIGNKCLNLFFINTFAYVNGYGYFAVRKLLRDISVKYLAHINIRMINSAPTKKTVDAEKEKILKHKALKKINRFVGRIEGDKTDIQGLGPHLLMGCMIRNILRNPIKNNYKYMKVDTARCSKCNQCLKNCPTGSIKVIDSVYSFTNTCTVCMRCYHICTKKAIKIV